MVLNHCNISLWGGVSAAGSTPFRDGVATCNQGWRLRASCTDSCTWARCIERPPTVADQRRSRGSGVSAGSADASPSLPFASNLPPPAALHLLAAAPVVDARRLTRLNEAPSPAGPEAWIRLDGTTNYADMEETQSSQFL